MPAKLFDESEATVICAYYVSGLSAPTIRAKLGRGSIHAIMRCLHAAHIPIRDSGEAHRRYSCDSEYFNVVGNATRAYWLGFLAADGSISDQRHTVKLTLKRGDRDHLQRFAQAIRANNPILDYMSRCQTGSYPSSEICIRDIRLVDALIGYGVTPRKSFTLKWPELREDIQRDFVRGYVDGNGGFSLSKAGNFQWYVTSHKAFIDSMEEYFWINEFHNLSRYQHSRSPKMHTLYACASTALAIGDFLYADASDYLARKHATWCLYRNQIAVA